jgi:hypothetical protein
MTSATILTRFDDRNTWRQGDQWAPLKPLLVLYALGRWQQGKPEVTYRDAEPELTALLREFGPPRKSDHPEHQFLRLQRDSVWTVQAPADLPMKTGDDITRVTALRSAALVKLLVDALTGLLFGRRGRCSFCCLDTAIILR